MQTEIERARQKEQQRQLNLKIKRTNEEIKEDTNEILEKHGVSGAAANELERLNQGGTDFSLFNLMLERVDFTVLKDPTPMDAMRAMYESLWPYFRKLVRENAFFRDAMKDMPITEHLNGTQLQQLEEIFKSDVDPSAGATKILEEIKQAALKRRKMNIY